MTFKLGDIVRYRRYDVEATVVATDGRDSEFVLLGWKEGETRYEMSYPTNSVVLIRTDQSLPNWKEEYAYAYWEDTRSLLLIKSKRRFTKVNANTLRKRMRDQIAQEALSIKE